MNTEDQLKEEQGICLHARRGKATNTNKHPNRHGRQMEGRMEEEKETEGDRGEERRKIGGEEWRGLKYISLIVELLKRSAFVEHKMNSSLSLKQEHYLLC